MSILPNRLKRPSDRRQPPRRAVLAALAVGSILLLSACAGEAGQTPEPERNSASSAGSGAGKTAVVTKANPEQATVEYRVPTITCPSCAARVEANAQKDPGVLDVHVEGQRVSVEYDPAETNPRKIAGAMRSSGDTVLQGG